MGMQVNANTPALGVQQQVGAAAHRLIQGFQRLATGLRINRAADDASGLAISERLREDIRQYTAEVNNLQTGVNVTQMADEALGTQQEGLQRVRELAVQAANGTLTAEQRNALNAEAQQILGQIQETANNTEFNGTQLLNGSATNIPIGTEGGMRVTINESTTASLGVNGVNLTTQEGAAAAVEALDTALARIDQNRAGVGAQRNRFERAIANREMAIENAQASESRIRDLDYARQTIEQNRNAMLLQGGVAMLAQANLQNRNVARLLGA
ncbi:MAG: flagellin FliC [Acidobacteria bacterium]|nr:flagellin FliC [Acidobacteriota bacterium]